MILDLRKLERPHRSGMISILIAYALVTAWNGHLASRFPGEANWKRTVLCITIPFACFQFTPPPPPRYHEITAYEDTKLVFCPKCPVRKKNENPYCLIIDNIMDPINFYSVYCGISPKQNPWLMENVPTDGWYDRKDLPPGKNLFFKFGNFSASIPLKENDAIRLLRCDYKEGFYEMKSAEVWYACPGLLPKDYWDDVKKFDEEVKKRNERARLLDPHANY